MGAVRRISGPVLELIQGTIGDGSPAYRPQDQAPSQAQLLQVSIATAALLGTLWTEQALSGGDAARPVVVAAIASTGFILFISPRSLSARPRHAIGGHLIAMAIATPLSLLADPDVIGWVDTTSFLFAVYAAIGVGASMFAMAATNTEQLPAAGTALALVAHGFSWELIVFVATAVLIIVAIHRVLKRHLIDLF